MSTSKTNRSKSSDVRLLLLMISLGVALFLGEKSVEYYFASAMHYIGSQSEMLVRENKFSLKGRVKVESNDIVARFIESWGDVRVRRRDQLYFERASESVPLYRGDRVYTGGNGAARIQMTMGVSAILALPPNNIYEIDRTLPASNMGLRRVRRNEDDWENQIQHKDAPSQAREGFVDPFLDDGKGDNVSYKALEEVSLPSLRVVQEAKIINFLFPDGNIFGYCKDFPCKYEIILKRSLKADAQGYLWLNKPTSKLVFTELVEANKTRFTLEVPHAGEFVFQIFSSDGDFRTRSFKIYQTDLAKTNFQFPQLVQERDSVIVQ